MATAALALAVVAWRDVRRNNAVGCEAAAAAEELDRSRRAAVDSDERYAALAETIPQLLWVARPDGGLLDANRRWASYTGVEWEDSLGLTWQDVVHPDDLPAALALWKEAATAGAAFEAEFRLRRHDAAYRWHINRAVPVRDPHTGATRWYGTSTDVDDQKRAEQAVREREELLRGVIAHIPVGVFWKDRNSVYLGCNEQAARDLGIASPKDLVGRADGDLPGDPGEVAFYRACDRRVMETGEPMLDIEETLTRPDGSKAVLRISKVPLRDGAGAVVGVLGVYRDVTEERRLESQLRQAQKMEAVGRLAGGVAHDFNNLLTAITGFSALALEALSADSPARGPIAEVARAGDRAAGLTRQLLAFSRQQVLAPRVLDPNAVVADLGKMLRRVIGEDVELATVLAPGVWPVLADPGQVEQVLVNLAVNARDAMPRGGRLTIETGNAVVGEGESAAPGQYAVLTVADTGHGMDDATKAHIFEPFFTTKGTGKGTGLGLATVYGIVQQSGGHIAVESEPGRGTAFRVYLPRTDKVAAPVPSQAGVIPLPRGSEAVLVAEDEPAVRALTCRVLRRAGYSVLEAGSGEEAVRVAERHPGPVHLFVTDVVMPGVGGREAAGRVLARHPEARVLYMSGYTDDAVVRHGVRHDRTHFIQKPFSPAALATKVREVLDAPVETPAGVPA
jgi:PAS domain S-box-containing protein